MTDLLFSGKIQVYNINGDFNDEISTIRHRYNFLKNRVRVVVFNATFNNISVISFRSVLLVEDTDLSLTNFIT